MRACRQCGYSFLIRSGSKKEFCRPACEQEFMGQHASDDEKIAARKRAAHARNKAREKMLWKKYRLTPEQYDEMEAAQAGACAICRQVPVERTAAGLPKRLAVDHNHSSGVVRALLCPTCNLMVGILENNWQRLGPFAAYLERHGGIAISAISEAISLGDSGVILPFESSAMGGRT